MNYRDIILKNFGVNAFSHSLFYCYKDSLRFKLSNGGYYIDQFITAFKKSEEICTSVLGDSKIFYVCLSFYGGESFLSSLSRFKNIRKCQIRIPKDYIGWAEKVADEDDENCTIYRHFITFEANTNILNILLWGALSCDLGIKPTLKAKVFIINREIDTIIHPYDDRGMDIVSINYELLKYLYKNFNHYLLDYDREKMDSTVGSL